MGKEEQRHSKAEREKFVEVGTSKEIDTQKESHLRAVINWLIDFLNFNWDMVCQERYFKNINQGTFLVAQCLRIHLLDSGRAHAKEYFLELLLPLSLSLW